MLVKRVKRSSIILVAGCLTALVLGLALAYPLLISDLPVTKKVDLDVDVVYAYFGSLNFNANITGLWRNYSLPQEAVNINGVPYGYDVNVISYLIVLNVTNPSGQEAGITNFDLIVGPQISTAPGEGLQAGNAIVIDSRYIMYYLGWSGIWSANTSRLIFLSGIVGAHDLSYGALNKGSIYVYAHVNGQAWTGEKAQFVGAYLKQVPLQTFGDQYLYNNLLNENQTLIFYNELDVSVGTRVQS
jgi:hypothetical protein